MGDWQEVDNIQISESQKFDDVIKDVEEKIKNIPRHHKHVPLDYREFEQFKRGWFYRHWENRFRRLGQVGVVAIPNTTLQDWIIWLYEWSQKMTDDYNEFKRLVYEAIKLHEEHLQIHDAQIKDLTSRVTEIEKQLQEIWNKINNILDDISKIWAEIGNIKNEIDNLHKKDDDLQNQIDAFKANVFNVSYPYKTLGTLKNGWAMKHENPLEDFAFMWGWNNNDDHSQGVHFTPLLNYIYKTGVFNVTMVGDSLVGTIPVPQEVRDAGFTMGENWIYAGFVAQSSQLVGNVYLHLVPNGNDIDIKILNTVHTGWDDLLEPLEFQINTGGAVPQYLT